ncbi:MAG: hypothetical protein GWM92_00425 [Gemmatimonadetes bacterium]|nr:hypothetical protein [Gemmatimonadota bacterium]NIR76904.1 hypothetical protein [Gemmatimonadota bacterium]NIT85425.1 hypothetical protein [Gemmatimonadota bacterium]NIU29246.1 hypothetical protein [Gemmatimonadota bacterium]NIU34332.1 hypothetical protein [Gemmatimonadota bacterium]
MKTNSLVAAALLLLLAPGGAPGQMGGVTGVVERNGVPARDAVVSLHPATAGDAVSPAPSRAVIDQTSLRFVPGVVVVERGSTVEFMNSDPIHNNVFSPGWSGEEFDLGTYPSGTSRSHTFIETGPHVILCHVHPEMAAYVVVVDTPHHGVTDGEGRFGIEEAPPGTYGLRVWQRGFPIAEAEVVVPPDGSGSLLVDLSGSGGIEVLVSR